MSLEIDVLDVSNGDAIVVRENIVRHLEHGEDHISASRFGTSEIGLAVFATSASEVGWWAFVVFAAAVGISVWRRLGVERSILWASLRAALQLLAVGALFGLIFGSAAAMVWTAFDTESSSCPRSNARLFSAEAVKGLEFEHVYLLGLHQGAIEANPGEDEWVPPDLVSDALPEPGAELLARADVLSIHAPLTEETRHAIGEAELGRMKPTAVLVNTARGPIVDEAALARALEGGVIAGAGLDVYEHEPAVHEQVQARLAGITPAANEEVEVAPAGGAVGEWPLDLADAGVNIELFVPVGISDRHFTMAIGVDKVDEARKALGDMVTEWSMTAAGSAAR